MIEAAEAEGRIEPGRTTIVEATSGNTGIALAFVCAAKGYDLVLTLPQGMSREREGLLRLYGAQVHVTESMGGMNEAVAAAQAMARDADVFLPDQFSNPANPEAHRRTTGPELWEALDGKIDYLVAGVGTGGTITGAGSFLKERNPDLKVIAVEPASSPGARPAAAPARTRSRASAPASSRRCSTARLLDEIIGVDDEDAIETARRGRPPRGRAVRDLLRRGAVRGARDRRAPRGEGQADRGRAARQRRALRVDAVLRARARARVSHERPRGRGAGRRAVGAAAARHPRPARDRVRRARRTTRSATPRGARSTSTARPASSATTRKPLPSVYVIQGFTGQLDMWLSRQAFEPTMIERLDAMFAAGELPRRDRRVRRRLDVASAARSS